MKRSIRSFKLVDSGRDLEKDLASQAGFEPATNCYLQRFSLPQAAILSTELLAHFLAKSKLMFSNPPPLYIFRLNISSSKIVNVLIFFNNFFVNISLFFFMIKIPNIYFLYLASFQNSHFCRSKIFF